MDFSHSPELLQHLLTCSLAVPCGRNMVPTMVRLPDGGFVFAHTVWHQLAPATLTLPARYETVIEPLQPNMGGGHGSLVSTPT